MKPLFMWAGGKTKLLKHYQPYLPSYVTHYHEPFFGGGAMFIYVMKRYRPEYVLINDINPDIMRIYRMIRDNHSQFIKHMEEYQTKYIPLSKEDRKKYYFEVRHAHAFDYSSWSEVKEASTLYFLMKTGFNGIYQINQNTNGRYGTPSGLLNQKDTVYDKEVVKWWNEALQKVEITSKDWKEVKAPPSKMYAFHFFDPPYRTSYADYGHEFNDKDLLELIDYANECPQVFLANRADDDFFEKQKHNLNVAYFDITYTAGRRKKTDTGHVAKKATEILLYNVKEGVTVV